MIVVKWQMSDKMQKENKRVNHNKNKFINQSGICKQHEKNNGEFSEMNLS